MSSRRMWPGVSRGFVASAQLGATITVLLLATMRSASAVPPETGATFTNPQAQASLEAGVAATR